MDLQPKETLAAFGVTVTIVKDGEAVRVVITKEESVKLYVSRPPEPSPWTGCGAMC